MVTSFTDGFDTSVAPEIAFADLLAEEFPEATPTQRTAVQGSNLDETFRAWLTEEGRKTGDITAIEAANGAGWYVLMFQERSDNTEEVVAVRHILVMAEADENGVYTDEAKQAALARIEEIRAEFENGDKTEESFAALAEQYSEDAGSNTNGGLYENIHKGPMVPEFDAFCFAAHKKGDLDVVYGENSGYAGYHLVYFVGEGDLYSNVIAENALLSDAVNAFVEEQIEGYEPVLRFWSRYAGR
jgi:parvulin-like peptidyl-prolyl isomerase